MSIIDRVKYDGPANTLVWRAPGDNLSWGTQVIVNESQEAIFYKGGKALDLLPPGTHTLKTANIPLLRGLIAAPFGGNTPFAAEIYYINKAANLDVKWGTASPMQVQDPKYSVILPVRANGQFGVQVADSRLFVPKIAGTMPAYGVEQLSAYFRGMLQAMAKDALGQAIVKRKISVLDISANLLELSEEVLGHLKPKFEEFGVALLNFYFASVDFPEDDPSVVKLKEALASNAEMSIQGENYRVRRGLDVLEDAANNQGGLPAAAMGLGLGIGAGANAASTLAATLATPMATAKPAAAAQPPVASTVECQGCHARVAAGAHFCPECGKQVTPLTCAKCHTVLAPGAKFCPECGEKVASPADPAPPTPPPPPPAEAPTA